MNLPGFTSEASLGRPRGHYNAANLGGATNLGAVQPQQRGCFCSEPDLRTVCTGSGASRRCVQKEVCLQWFCPGRGTDVDPEDYFGSD